MLDISTVVNVSISRQTAQVTQKGFGRALIYGTSGKFTNGTARLYASLAEVAVDFLGSDPEYRAAAAYFSQNPAPQDCYISQTATGTAVDTGMGTLVGAGYTDYYAIIIAPGDDNTAANIALLAAWNEAQAFKRIVISALDDADSLDAGSTTDTAYVLKAANYARTSFMYDGGTYPGLHAAAWAGKMLPTLPGSSNWAYKTLAGETADDLTSAQLAALEAKNGNDFVSIGGVDVTRLGTMADGEYIDVIVGCDWIQSVMQEEIYTLLVSVPKIPFTDAGIALVQNVITGVLKRAVTQGILASYDVPEVRASDYTSAQKQTRVLSNLTFTGQLAGAVNKVTVQGNVFF